MGIIFRLGLFATGLILCIGEDCLNESQMRGDLFLSPSISAGTSKSKSLRWQHGLHTPRRSQSHTACLFERLKDTVSISCAFLGREQCSQMLTNFGLSELTGGGLWICEEPAQAWESHIAGTGRRIDSWRLVAWYRQRFLSDNLKREYKSLIHSYSIEYKKGEDCKWLSFCSELWSYRQLRHINIFRFMERTEFTPVYLWQ